MFFRKGRPYARRSGPFRSFSTIFDLTAIAPQLALRIETPQHGQSQRSTRLPLRLRIMPHFALYQNTCACSPSLPEPCARRA